MPSTITPGAIEIIRSSLELANADTATMGVRLRVAGGAIRPRFVEGPEDGDETLDADGLRVYIAKAIIDEHGAVEVDVTPEHGQLIVRPLSA